MLGTSPIASTPIAALPVAAAGGGGSQALAITLDGVTVAAAQNLQHSQALAITLDGVTVAAGQARQYSQSLAATLDGVTVAAAQNLRHSQALSATLDDVTASVAQNLRHAQALDATLDGVTVEVAQAKSGENSQSLAITLDDVSVEITQGGAVVQPSVGFIHRGRTRKTAKEIEKERIRLGIIPEAVAKVVVKAAQNAIDQATQQREPDVIGWVEDHEEMYQRQIRRDIARSDMVWDKAYRRLFEIALHDALIQEEETVIHLLMHEL